MSERYILVGWFNPYNEYHGFQQVHQDHEGEKGTFPLYVRECDLLKIEIDEKMPTPRQPSDVKGAPDHG
jgi:hypothetical protein